MALGQVHHQEEEQGTSRPSWSVELHGLVNSRLRLLRNHSFLLHIVGGLLGILQTNNQVRIVQDVSLGIGQLLQQQGLKLRKLDLKLILLLDELTLRPRQIRALQHHDQEEQLILETRFGDSEIDEGAFGLNLRRVMRVGQLCLHKEPEVGRIVDLLVSKLDGLGVSSLDHISRNDWLQCCINRFLHVLHQHGPARCNCLLEHHNHLGMTHSCHHQPIVGLPSLHPYHPLHLRVNQHRPPLPASENSPVLQAHSVTG
mmetsp:Transcript_44425/g.100270  ORF Transcript_44425/g.100270 Transcript_44425/m.100270 type:complete len:257 (-) Transcript_44425:1846-2616(-)